MPLPSRLFSLAARTAVLVLALLLGTGALAQAEPVANTALTISAPASVATGTSATIGGTLRTDTGTPVGRAMITVRWRKAGSTEWIRSQQVSTSTKGNWSAALPMIFSTEVRADYAGSGSTGASTSMITSTQATQWVKINSGFPARPEIGQWITFTGSAAPALARRTVALEQLVGGRWLVVAGTTVNRDRTFAVRVRTANASTKTFRVRTDSAPAVSRATSSNRVVRVSVSGTLYAGGRLSARHALTSPNGVYTATMRTGGDLVITDGAGATIWSAGTGGTGFALRLSSDGNLTIGTADHAAWSSASAAPDARLVLQNNGSLVLFSRARSLWSSTLGAAATVKPALCWSLTFDCITYTSYVPSTSYWRMYAGHNCTNYVAYRMILKGVQNPPWGYPGGSAWQWRAGAKRAGIRVDTRPSVGAVMQWDRNTNGGGSSGHVTYVEAVSSTTVTISEDSWSGHSAVRVIDRTSSAYRDARFLHLKDSGS